MRKIFTRYVLTLVLAAWVSLLMAADEVLINEDFSGTEFSGIIFGKVNNLANDWTVYACQLGYGLYTETINFGMSGTDFGYVTTKPFGKQVTGYNAKLSFSYANSTDNPSGFNVTINGEGTFENGTKIARYPELRTAKGVFCTLSHNIYGASSETSITITLTSERIYFYLDDIKVVASTPITISESDDASSFTAQLADVTLGRSLAAGVWSTMCLPFDVTTEMMKTAMNVTEVKMCTFTSYANETMTFTKVDEVAAGTPFLVKVNANVTNPTFLLVDVKNTAASEVTKGDVSMVGCYGQTTLTAGDGQQAVFLTADGALKKPSAASSTMKGLRAYFRVPSNFAGARLMIADEEATGIDLTLQDDAPADGAVYNLAGQRLTQPTAPGFYVSNGKKIIIK